MLEAVDAHVLAIIHPNGFSCTQIGGMFKTDPKVELDYERGKFLLKTLGLTVSIAAGCCNILACMLTMPCVGICFRRAACTHAKYLRYACVASMHVLRITSQLTTPGNYGYCMTILAQSSVSPFLMQIFAHPCRNTRRTSRRGSSRTRPSCSGTTGAHARSSGSHGVPVMLNI